MSLSSPPLNTVFPLLDIFPYRCNHRVCSLASHFTPQSFVLHTLDVPVFLFLRKLYISLELLLIYFYTGSGLHCFILSIVQKVAMNMVTQIYLDSNFVYFIQDHSKCQNPAFVL